MNIEQVKGNWLQLKGKVKETWGDLTDDELDQISGNMDQLNGALQKHYGKSKEEAQKEIDQFLASQ